MLFVVAASPWWVAFLPLSIVDLPVLVLSSLVVAVVSSSLLVGSWLIVMLVPSRLLMSVLVVLSVLLLLDHIAQIFVTVVRVVFFLLLSVFEGGRTTSHEVETHLLGLLDRILLVASVVVLLRPVLSISLPSTTMPVAALSITSVAPSVLGLLCLAHCLHLLIKLCFDVSILFKDTFVFLEIDHHLLFDPLCLWLLLGPVLVLVCSMSLILVDEELVALKSLRLRVDHEGNTQLVILVGLV